MTPAPAAPPLTDREIMLYGKLWQHAVRPSPLYDAVGCHECGAAAPDRLAVVHAPGCVFRGLDARTLAAISADWTPTA